MTTNPEAAEPAQRSLAKTAVIYVASNILSAAIPFALMPFLTRSLTPADYGITAMFTTLVAVFGCFAGINVHGAVNLRYFKREGFDLPTYVGTSLSLLASSTSIVLLIVLAFRSMIARLVEIPEQWVVAAVFVACANFVGQIRLVLWQAETKATQHLAFSVASSLLNFISSIALVVVAKMHFQGRLIAATLTAVLFAIVSLVSLRRSKLVRFTYDASAARDALHFGLPLIPHTLGGLITTLADRFFITKYAGVSHTGVYVVGSQIAMIIGLLADASNRAYSPWLFRQLEVADHSLKRRIVRNTYVYFVAIAALALSLSGVAPFALSILVGPQFVSAAQFVLWLSLAASFRGMYLMVADFIFYAKKTHLLAVSTFLTSVMNVLLNYILIRRNGVLGAAQATCAAYFISFVATWFISARTYPMPWFRGRAER